jgi:hypothetical protein
MKKTTYLFLTTLFTITIFSCDPAKEFENEIKTIDAALVEIDSLENVLDGINFDSLTIMVNHVIDNESFIKENYVTDTINEALGEAMNEAKSVRKRLKDLPGKKAKFGDELNMMKHQFLDLETDLKAGKLSKDQADQYLDNELKSLEIFGGAFNEFYQIQKDEKARYYHATPYVDEFILFLKERQAVEEN